MTTAETINRLHERFKWPAPTNVELKAQTVRCNIGHRRYMVFPNLEVREILADHVADTEFGRWVQGILQR